MTKKKVKKKAYRGFVGYIVIPLLIINSYAFWHLYQAAGHWSLSFWPNSISESMTQLAIILLINSFAILALVLYIKFK
jgi:hypothetical protein